ncbi:MAG TPA: 4-(cytidine 5'-diphospho)-2-C-methyl-D-erythritol kinase [Terriglobales bacterium]|nr:4-(cytidine 5'-diphospho)-2-C-methyl-D-erythritol kinase [Terriglobales bacterium]
MPVRVRSFAKINLGLTIGAKRSDGFHELRTIYQMIGVHDLVRVHTRKGDGIEIRCTDERVPRDESNTCYRMAERVLEALGTTAKVVIEIEKELPPQGGLGGASSNAVAVMLALERALKTQIPADEKLRMAAEIGSDLPQFLIGGTVLGVGRGEEVYPLPDLPPLPLVLATPDIGVSTPQAFAEWDNMVEGQQELAELELEEEDEPTETAKLTALSSSDRITSFNQRVFRWLGDWLPRQRNGAGKSSTGVPARRGGSRAETLLLDLVRAGIKNDFERVVYSLYPELREVRRLLRLEGARYVSLSGSGSTLYGIFESNAQAEQVAASMTAAGVPSRATVSLSRQQYWRQMFGK